MLNGNTQEKAKAVYMAVCLDIADSLKSTYPKQWGKACYSLSGYWKVINNVFYGDVFKDIVKLQDKFIAQGFKKPIEIATNKQLFEGRIVWKDPTTLY